MTGVNRVISSRRPLSMSGGAGEEAESLLLDDVSGAAFAYSVRKIRAGHTGSAIRVRRASDNAEQDIGFDGNNLDTSSLETFCSATDGFVTKWYDQSGNDDHLTQSSTSIQPQIVSSGSTITDGTNSRPALHFLNKDYLKTSSATSTYTWLHDGTIYAGAFVLSRDTAQTGRDVFITNKNLTNASEGQSLYIWSGTSPSSRLGNSSSAYVIDRTGSQTISTETSTVVSMYFDPSNATAADRLDVWVDNTISTFNNSSSATPSSGDTGVNLTVGAKGSATSDHWTGKMQAIILWDSDVLSSRSTWESDIATYYGVTLS